MIDLHNHILPSVDDGAADIEESVEIARQFASEGVSLIAATPHLDPEHGGGPAAEVVRGLVTQVQTAVDAAGIELKIVPGQEIFLTPELPDLLEQGVAQSLGDGKAVLVELFLGAGERPLYLDDTLFRLQLAGHFPVLAHPERYPFMQRHPELAEPLVNRGVVLQLTAPSLLGLYGAQVRQTAERLLLRGLYCVGASDRHHPGRERSLADMHARIADLTDASTADLLLRTNPGRVLEGLEPERPAPGPAGERSVLGRILGRQGA